MNQRFLLTTYAITVFGVLVAWLVPRSRTDFFPEAAFLVSYALTGILIALLWMHYVLLWWMRVLTCYLDEAGLSNWEMHFKQYRNEQPYPKGPNEHEYIGQSIPQLAIFRGLGVLAIVTPSVMCLLYLLPPPQWGSLGSLLLLLFYERSLSQWRELPKSYVDSVRQHWREIVRNSPKESRDAHKMIRNLS